MSVVAVALKKKKKGDGRNEELEGDRGSKGTREKIRNWKER